MPDREAEESCSQRTIPALAAQCIGARRRVVVAPLADRPVELRSATLRLTSLVVCLTGAGSAWSQETVTFAADDGIVIHADRYDQWVGRSRGVILLFHQEDGNAAEYYEIGLRLAAQGFDALAIDQRLAGTVFGMPNRTVAGLTRPVMSTDAVLPDLWAALDYAKETWPAMPILLWGSSYSADLVVALAADAPEKVVGILAFSPEGLMRERDLLDVAGSVSVPVFITYASTDGELAFAVDLANALPDGLVTLDVPASGAHGSLTLMDAVNPAGWEAEWEAVNAFLAQIAP